MREFFKTDNTIVRPNLPDSFDMSASDMQSEKEIKDVVVHGIVEMGQLMEMVPGITEISLAEFQAMSTPGGLYRNENIHDLWNILHGGSFRLERDAQFTDRPNATLSGGHSARVIELAFSEGFSSFLGGRAKVLVLYKPDDTWEKRMKPIEKYATEEHVFKQQRMVQVMSAEIRAESVVCFAVRYNLIDCLKSGVALDHTIFTDEERRRYELAQEEYHAESPHPFFVYRCYKYE